MAKYNITYKCGHRGTVELFGPGDGRRLKIAWLEMKDCPKCYADKQAAEKAARLEAARTATAGLPALSGSDKQINWATEIRARIMADKPALLAATRPEMRETIDNIIAAIEGNTLAGWWIDHRGYTLNTLVLDAYRAANNQ